jgi:hypothetical protein
VPADRILRKLTIAALTPLIMLVLLSATPSPALGYADPGTGAFLYQAVYAAVIGGVFYFRKFISRLWRKRDK